MKIFIGVLNCLSTRYCLAKILKFSLKLRNVAVCLNALVRQIITCSNFSQSTAVKKEKELRKLSMINI